MNKTVLTMNATKDHQLLLMKTPTKTQNPSHRICMTLLAVTGLTLISAVTARADYRSAVLASHPVGYWPLDLGAETNKNALTGNYIAADLSGHGNFGDYINIMPNNGQNTNGPSGFISNAVAFNGINTWVDLSVGSNTALLNVVGPISMEAWVEATIPQYNGQYGLILSKGYDLSQQVDDIDLHIISTDSSDTAYYYWGGIYTGWNSLNQQAAQGAPTTTRWQHVVATWEQISGTNGLWNLYVDGVLMATNQAVGPALYAGPPFAQGFAFIDPWAIGNGTADGGAGRLFSGNLSQIALYTNALTAVEVLTHYEIGIYGLPVLSVARGATGSVVLSWMGAGYTLQSTPSLSSPTWADAPSGTNNPATVIIGSSNKYFRLRN